MINRKKKSLTPDEGKLWKYSEPSSLQSFPLEILIWRSLVHHIMLYICHNIRKCWELKVSLTKSLIVWQLWFEVWHQIRLEPIVPSTNDVRRSSLDRTLQWEYFHNFPSSVVGVNDFFLLIIIVFDVFKVFFKLQSLVSRFKHTHATSYRVSHIKECKLNLEICTFCENTTRFYEMFFTMYPI